jgi:hypothetical protein
MFCEQLHLRVADIWALVQKEILKTGLVGGHALQQLGAQRGDRIRRQEAKSVKTRGSDTQRGI